jgi:hypothetical protein
VRIAQATPNTSALLLTGVSDRFANGVPLPFDLGLLGAPSCFLRVSNEIAVSVPIDASGVGTFTLPVSGDPALVGITIHQRAFVRGSGANALGLAATDAARLLIGGVP